MVPLRSTRTKKSVFVCLFAFAQYGLYTLRRKPTSIRIIVNRAEVSNNYSYFIDVVIQGSDENTNLMWPGR